MNITEVVQQIQYMVAPAVMVSSSALLLLAFHNKFSNLASRFRVLNQEKRVLSQKQQRAAVEEARLSSLTMQVDHLMKRASYVKNAILCTYGAIICFVSTSILIFCGSYSSIQIKFWSTMIFFLGFLALITTSALLILETRLFYRVMVLEKEN